MKVDGPIDKDKHKRRKTRCKSSLSAEAWVSRRVKCELRIRMSTKVFNDFLGRMKRELVYRGGGDNAISWGMKWSWKGLHGYSEVTGVSSLTSAVNEMFKFELCVEYYTPTFSWLWYYDSL